MKDSTRQRKVSRRKARQKYLRHQRRLANQRRQAIAKTDILARKAAK